MDNNLLLPRARIDYPLGCIVKLFYSKELGMVIGHRIRTQTNSDGSWEIIELILQHPNGLSFFAWASPQILDKLDELDPFYPELMNQFTPALVMNRLSERK